MTIYLSEYKANLDKYMKIAQITDVKIISDTHEKTWILTSPKTDRWAEKVLPLLRPRAAAI